MINGRRDFLQLLTVIWAVVFACAAVAESAYIRFDELDGQLYVMEGDHGLPISAIDENGNKVGGNIRQIPPGTRITFTTPDGDVRWAARTSQGWLRLEYRRGAKARKVPHLAPVDFVELDGQLYVMESGYGLPISAIDDNDNEVNVENIRQIPPGTWITFTIPDGDVRWAVKTNQGWLRSKYRRGAKARSHLRPLYFGTFRGQLIIEHYDGGEPIREPIRAINENGDEITAENFESLPVGSVITFRGGIERAVKTAAGWHNLGEIEFAAQLVRGVIDMAKTIWLSGKGLLVAGQSILGFGEERLEQYNEDIKERERKQMSRRPAPEFDIESPTTWGQVIGSGAILLELIYILFWVVWLIYKMSRRSIPEFDIGTWGQAIGGGAVVIFVYYILFWAGLGWLMGLIYIVTWFGEVWNFD